MSVAPDGVIYMARLLAVLLVLGLASPVAARFRVCTLAFNGPEEVDVFRERLPPQDFEIVDLSAALATPAPAADAPASWPAGLCPADLRCDVVVFSAEFGGRFFGRSVDDIRGVQQPGGRRRTTVARAQAHLRAGRRHVRDHAA